MALVAGRPGTRSRELSFERLEDRVVPIAANLHLSYSSGNATSRSMGGDTSSTVPGSSDDFHADAGSASASGSLHQETFRDTPNAGAVVQTSVGGGYQHDSPRLVGSATADVTIKVDLQPDDPADVGTRAQIGISWTFWRPDFASLSPVADGPSSFTEGRAEYAFAGGGGTLFDGSSSSPPPFNGSVTFAGTLGTSGSITVHSASQASVGPDPGDMYNGADSGISVGVSILRLYPRLPDFVAVPNADSTNPDKFAWNSLDDGGGFKFTYKIASASDNAAVPDAAVKFYWASGPQFEDRVSIPIYLFNIDAAEEKTPGEHTVDVHHTDLFAGVRSPPWVKDAAGHAVRASYLVGVIDPPTDYFPQGLVDESDESNNSVALPVVPLVVNVVTHGFNFYLNSVWNPRFDWTNGELSVTSYDVTDLGNPSWVSYRSGFEDIALDLNATPAPDSILDGRVATYVTQWDSSSGFAEAFLCRMLALLAHSAAGLNRQKADAIRGQLQTPGLPSDTSYNLGLAIKALAAKADLEDQTATGLYQLIPGRQAVAATNATAAVGRIYTDLTTDPKYLGQLSTPASNYLQRVQLIGTSRGAAVNAAVTNQLGSSDYKNVVYYAALDGLGSDFVDPIQGLSPGNLIDGKGMLVTDYETAGAAVGSDPQAMKISYRVERGLQDYILREQIDPILRYLGSFDESILDPAVRDAVLNNNVLRAQVRAPENGWENAVLRKWTSSASHRPSGEQVSHVTAVDAYAESDDTTTHPADEQYFFDSYLGWNRNAGTALPKSLQEGQFDHGTISAAGPVAAAPRPRTNLLVTADGSLSRLDTWTDVASPLGRLPFAPLDVAVDPAGRTFALAYEGQGATGLYRVAVGRAGTPTATRVGPLGAYLNALAFRGDGALFGAGGNVLYRIDQGTGAAAAVSTGPADFVSAGGLAFAPDGTAELTGEGTGGQLARIEADSRTWTALGRGAYVPDLGGLRLVGDTLVAYGQGGRAYTLDPATGTATPVAGVTGVGNVVGFSTGFLADPAGRSLLLGDTQFAVGGPGVVALYDADQSTRARVTPFAGFAGDVRTATADFNGDGVADLVVGTGPGSATHVRVLDGVDQHELFAADPFEAGFTGGVYVAAGDLDGDGVPDLVITPDEGGGPRVDVYAGDGFGKLASFFGIDDPNFRGGARAATGDLNGDGAADLIVVAGFGGGPRVAGFDGRSVGGTPARLFGDFFAFEQGLRNGIFIAAGDVDGDGYADLVAGGGPGGGPRVTVFSGKALLADAYDVRANFFGGDDGSRGGVRVAVKDLDGDNRADIVVGAGAGGGSRVTAYLGQAVTPTGPPPETFAFDAFSGFPGGVFVG